MTYHAATPIHKVKWLFDKVIFRDHVENNVLYLQYQSAYSNQSW